MGALEEVRVYGMGILDGDVYRRDERVMRGGRQEQGREERNVTVVGVNRCGCECA